MHVRIATPSYSGAPAAAYLDSIEATAAALRARGVEASIDMVLGDCYVQRARNMLVARFLECGADRLLFIDDDLDWPAAAALRLIEAPWPICAGVYPMKRDEPDYPAVLATHLQTHQPMGRDGWLHATHVPTGFLCISRQAILTLQAANPYRTYRDLDLDEGVERQVYDLFPQGLAEGRWWGEDFAFCNLWNALGGQIWVWPDITFGHHAKGGRRHEGNYDRYLRALPAPGWAIREPEAA